VQAANIGFFASGGRRGRCRNAFGILLARDRADFDLRLGDGCDARTLGRCNRLK
jgi:hypothetical protein